MKPLDRKTISPDYEVRPYRPSDREVIRQLCCDTGFLGEPIDPIFSDRELFADYLTSYYTDWEPESTWVGVADGQVVGYLTACKRWNLNRLWSVLIIFKLAACAFARLLAGRYDKQDRQYMSWIFFHGWRETPPAPRQSAHYHFNARKEHRRLNMMRDLMVTMYEELRKSGVRLIYGQMATFENKRSDRLFEYLGWKVIAKKRVTKYKNVLDREIYLITAVKDLAADKSVKSAEVSLSKAEKEVPS